MKMNFGKRLLLFVHWLLSLFGCALAVALYIIPDKVQPLFERAYTLIGKRTFDTICIAILALYVLLAIGAVALVIFAGCKKRENRSFIVVDSSDNGKTRIAISAVDQMIRRAVKSVDGIGEVKTWIENHEDAISIHLNVSLLKNIHVPTATMNIQRAVRGYIEQNCGVAVRQVSVTVKAVEPGDGAPVQAPDASSYTPAEPERAPEHVNEAGAENIVSEPDSNNDIPVLTLDPEIDIDAPKTEETPRDEENE